MIARERERGEDRPPREPDASHAILDTQVDQDVGDNGMNVKVEMPIDMVEAADQFQVKLDLRTDFITQPGPKVTIEVVAHASTHGTFEKISRGIDDAGKTIRRQR